MARTPEIKLDIEIPVNTSAEVYLPAQPADLISEGGNKITGSELIENMKVNDEYIILKLGSGNYSFNVKGYKSDLN